jgi:hypothetical protein
MQSDDVRSFSLVKMAIHRVAHLLPKRVQRLRFGKDGLTKALAIEPPSTASSITKMISFMSYRSKAPLDSPRFGVNSQERSREDSRHHTFVGWTANGRGWNHGVVDNSGRAFCDNTQAVHDWLYVADRAER